MISTMVLRPRALAAVVGFGLCLSSMIAVAQDATPDTPTLDDLDQLVGIWKTTIEQDEGEQIRFLTFRKHPDLNALSQRIFDVDPESKQLQRVTFGYVGIPLRTGQIQGLVFTSDGLVAETIGILKEQVLYLKGFGTMADGTRGAADISYRINDDGTLVQEWTNMVGPTVDLPESITREFVKVDAEPMSLFRDGHIVAPENVEPAASLAALSHLLGHWQSVDAEGTVQHDQFWRPWGMGRWLAERWRLANGNSGINISGVDPATGRLTLWSINRRVIGRVGHWEVLNDNTVGQVQGGNRLDRELIKTDTEEMLFSRWMTTENGRYISTDNSYLVKRVPPVQNNEAGQASAAESSQQIDYGEPKIFARIEYMQVPEGGEELYLKVEEAWKKIHRARRDAGFINNWMLAKVSRSPEAKGDYNYVVVHLSDSFEKLRDGRVADLNLEFSSEEQEILGQTATAREMVRYDYWDLVTSADPDRFGQTGFDPAITIGMMQSKDEARHWELEKTVWQKLWKQQVTDGYLWNWHLWRRRTGDGFNFVTVHLRAEEKPTVDRPILSTQVQEKALPHMNREDFHESCKANK